jgi:hypothetical protein
MEQVLGIQPTGAGFREVTIRPELSGLTWASGGVPTPRGILQVDEHPGYLKVVLPIGTQATVQPPGDKKSWTLTHNGRAMSPEKTGADRNEGFTLSRSGVYIFREKSLGDAMEESR